MASIITGYEYDIFISYRQKDNKYDGWVTEFVDNLKKELEATFKEEISVYFDINPHDGLLETHDVDASLKDKLKCLVFIPIISRTYCDPGSFAWEHEFKVFVELASKDQFGSKIKLPNGNVANRVLPITIYDLDQPDIKLCESMLGGVLRGIEFIYKEPGVNRPLRANEENPHDNLNHTIYRNQINKVGNTVKDIFTGLKQSVQKNEVVSNEVITPVSPAVKSKKPIKIIAGSVITAILIILGLFIVPKMFKAIEPLDKSIAVLPFTNLSNDPEQDYFSDGIVEAILNHLFKVGELEVISSTSTKRYKNTKLPLKEIGRELGVSTILEGSVQKIGNNVRITAQLIDARTDAHLWSEIYDKEFSDIFSIQSEVAQNVARELKATLTDKEKEQLGENATENPVAYNLYLQGRYNIQKRTKSGFEKSIDYFEKATTVDPAYALAYAGLADAYFLIGWWDFMPKSEAYTKSKEYVKQALSLDKDLAEAHTVLGGILTYWDWNWEEARKELQLATELNPKFTPAHQYYSELLDILNEHTEARIHIETALELDPFFYMLRLLSAIYFYHEGRYKESIDEYKITQELNPESNYTLFILKNYAMLGEDHKAIEVFEHFINQAALRGDSLGEIYADLIKYRINASDLKSVSNSIIELFLKMSPPPCTILAGMYARTGKTEESLYWLEKAFEDRNSNLPRINADPVYDQLRSEPRFQAIITKMGLSDYQTPK